MARFQPQLNENIYFVDGSYSDDFFIRQNQSGWLNSSNSNNKHSISLLSQLYKRQTKSDIFEYIPQDFTITTTNSSAKFNKIMLENTSSIISEFVKANPHETQYHLDINDDNGIISKFEQLYIGQEVKFEVVDFIFTHKFTEKLNLINFPNFLKPKSLRSNTNLPFGSRKKFNDNDEYTVKISINSFKNFIQKESNCTFNIHTKNHEYKCNIFGVLSSTVIRELLTKDPKVNNFQFDYPDEDEEFQSICKLFNFKTVNLTIDNANSIKEIGDELGIECILSVTGKFIAESEKLLKAIDEQQQIIDTIDNMFDILYSIKEKTVDSVFQTIIESKWISTKEKVIELSAFILQIIQTSTQLHSYLFDLLIKLDEKANEIEPLKVLLPFIAKNLLNEFSSENKLKKNNNDKKMFICPFIYLLYKKQIIKKDELLKTLKNITNTNENYFFISWFLPEFIETKMDSNSFNENTSLIQIQKTLNINLVYPCNQNKLDEYKLLRDKGEYDDEIAKSLRIDDVDTFQSITSKSGDNFLKGTVRENIFEPFFNNSIRYLNYSAAYGSVKCFKYLLLNDEKSDKSTFDYAVFGGNVELIRIVDNNSDDCIPTQQPTFRFGGFNPKQPLAPNGISNALNHTIKSHRNELFDWIFEQKTENLNNINNSFSLMKCSVENGNAHSIVQLIDHGFKFQNYSENISQLFNIAAENGFYLIINLLMNLVNKDSNMKISINPLSSVYFGNILILKTLIKIMNQTNYKSALIYSIQLNSTDIIQYFFETLIDDDSLILNQNNSKEILNASILSNSIETINYIIEKVDKKCPLKKFNITEISDLLNSSIFAEKNLISIKLIDIIYDNNPNYNFTDFIYRSIRNNLKDVTEHLINKKCQVYYENIANSISEIGSIDVDIFSMILNNVNSEIKEMLVNSIINNAILSKNKPLLKYLLKNSDVLDSSLFKAVETNDLEIVNIVLEKNSEPSFINNNYLNGTALHQSVRQNNLAIFKRLISIPGINPSIYNERMETPLSLAAFNLNIEIFRLIIEFYGDGIKNQKWQLLKSIELLYLQITNTNYNNNTYNYSQNTKYISNYGQNTITSPLLAYANNYDGNVVDEKNLNEKRIQILNLIYNTKCINDNCPNYFTFFDSACKINAIELVKNILQNDEVDVNIYTPSTGDTPLISSIKNRNDEISKLLIEYPKTNINYRNYERKSALFYAVQTEQNDIVTLLLNNPRFNLKENDINLAFLNANSTILKQILSLKSFDVNYVPINSFNTINKIGLKQPANQNQFARNRPQNANRNAWGQPQNANRNAWGQPQNANRNAWNQPQNANKNFGNQPNRMIVYYNIPRLIRAINENDKESIDLIINHPSFDKSRSQYFQAISILLFNNQKELLENSFKLKIESKCTPKNTINNDIIDINTNEKIASIVVNFPNTNGIELEIIQNKSTKLITIHLDDEIFNDLINFMFDNGFDPNEPLPNGFYPLQEAIKDHNDELINILIETNRIDYNKLIPDRDSDSSLTSYLHLIVRYARFELFAFFIQENLCDINTTNDLGETFLFEIIKVFSKFKDNNNNNEFESFASQFYECLVQLDNFDVEHKNNNGEDVLQIICRMNNSNMIDNNIAYGGNDDRENYIQEIFYLLTNLIQNEI